MICPSNTGCFGRNSLLKIINKYNEKYEDKIKITNISKINDNKLWDLIQMKINNKCSNKTTCWYNENEKDNSLRNFYKTHYANEKGNNFLKTTNINDALKQFESHFNYFTFFGAVPIDFDFIFDEIANINVIDLIYIKKIKYGFVFNLDPHTKPGSHWVSLFIDLEKEFIGYFDSYGICPPPKEVINLIDRIHKQIKKHTKINLNIKCNNIRHQRDKYNCGVYSIYFIYQCLIGRDFDDIINDIKTEKDMNEWRNKLFYF